MTVAHTEDDGVRQQSEAEGGFQRGLLWWVGSYRAPEHLRRYLVNGAILYTAADEDAEGELRALEIEPGDAVLSVTGSGCRTLSLVPAAPGRLMSVDANPLENYLLEFKMAAVRRLEREEALAFLGVRGDTERAHTYELLRGDLTTEARSFWDVNERVIRDGVMFSGAHEAHFRRFMRIILAPRQGLARELFSFDDIEDQRDFYYEKWDTWWWRLCIRDCIRPIIYRLFLPDPSYIAEVDLPDGGVGAYMHRRLEHTLTNHLARDNHVLAWMLLGRYLDDHHDTLPPYLMAEHYDAVRDSLDAISIYTEPVDAFLARQKSSTIDRFSLSDISGWMPRDVFVATLRELVRTGRPSARFCYRNFFTKRPFPSELSRDVRLSPELAEEVTDADRSFGYTFEIGDVAAG